MRIKELKNIEKEPQGFIYQKKIRGLVASLRGRPPTIIVHTIRPRAQQLLTTMNAQQTAHKIWAKKKERKRPQQLLTTMNAQRTAHKIWVKQKERKKGKAHERQEQAQVQHLTLYILSYHFSCAMVNKHIRRITSNQCGTQSTSLSV